MSTRIKKICGAFFLFGILVFGGLIVLEIKTAAVTKNSEIVAFEVRQGESSEEIIIRLRQENLIRSQFFTKVKRYTMPQSKFYVGTYNLNRNWSTGTILNHMSKVENVNGSNTVSITLKEGYWAKDMAAVIASQTSVTEKELISLWNNKDYISDLMLRYEHLPQEILENTDANVLMEGFLYPDTYDFYRETTAEAITEKILDNGLNKYLALKPQLANVDLDYYDLITLASVVEYEANKIEDMKLVTGVFLNRLDIGMKLQSSVTVCYSLYEFNDWKDCESAKNNQIDSPYNTYRYEGLPVGPILNPSNKSIESVLNYTPSNYLYFIADVYGDGTVYYSETFEQHKIYIEKYLGGH